MATSAEPTSTRKRPQPGSTASPFGRVVQGLAPENIVRGDEKTKRDHQKEMVLGAMGISIPMLAIAAIFTGLPASLPSVRHS